MNIDVNSKLPKRPMIVAVDFDGTIAEHHPEGFPKIGQSVVGAIAWLKELHDSGVKLILWTMRSDEPLAAACDWLLSHRVRFAHINENPDQESWSKSRKVYAHAYVDDNACGCPLRPSMGGSDRPMVDWSVVGPQLLAMLAERG